MVLTEALFLVAQTDPTVFSPAEIFVTLRVCSREGAGPDNSASAW